MFACSINCVARHPLGLASIGLASFLLPQQQTSRKHTETFDFLIYYVALQQSFKTFEELSFKNQGFSINVGTHHPSRFSNTRYFYDKD